MMRSLSLLGWGILLVMLLTGARAAGPDPAADGSVTELLDGSLAALDDALLVFADKPCPVSYRRARHAWNAVAWSFPAFARKEAIASLDSSREWLLREAETGRRSAETGVWQRLEAAVMAGCNPSARVTVLIEQVRSEVNQIRLFARDADLAPADLRFLIATDLYRQFTMTLGGYYRLDPNAGPADFAAYLNGLPPVVRSLNLLPVAIEEEISATGYELRARAALGLGALPAYENRILKWHAGLLHGVSVAELRSRYKMTAGPAEGAVPPNYYFTFAAPTYLETPPNHTSGKR